MRVATAVLVCVIAFLPAIACGPVPENPPSGVGSEWQGTITTEGNVTTVVNESGSVWGGDARMMEEASIGVDVGEEPYLFSSVRSLWATDEEIFVLDFQIAELRVFGRNGEHLRTIGRRGQGPGEFQVPFDFMVAPDGRIIVLDVGAGAFLVLSPEGEEVDRWPVDPRSLRGASPRTVQLTLDGGVWVPSPAGFTRIRREIEGQMRVVVEPSEERVMKRYGKEGVVERRPVPFPDFEPVMDNGEHVPLTGRLRWTMSPTGDLIAGVTSEYRFQIHRPNGSKTVVERRTPPPALDPDHFEWAVELRISRSRRSEPGWSWDPRAPDHRPSYRGFLTDRTGRIWVLRAGETSAVEPCDPDPLDVPWHEGRPRPCFRTVLTADVFDEDGKFLGSVDDFFGDLWTGDVGFPYRATFIDGNTALFTHQDEAGTIMVKRYRLVLPGEPARGGTSG